MKKVALIFLGTVLALFVLTYFFKKDQDEAVLVPKVATQKVVKKEPIVRWYTSLQVSEGKALFANNCASCHGFQAEKTVNWKKTLPDGSYPPPPLNDKAHAWHHPYSQLNSIIKNGGSSYGGKMPAFKEKLTQSEIDAIIAYFQSFWADEYYGYWLERGGKK